MDERILTKLYLESALMYFLMCNVDGSSLFALLNSLLTGYYAPRFRLSTHKSGFRVIYTFL